MEDGKYGDVKREDEETSKGKMITIKNYYEGNVKNADFVDMKNEKINKSSAVLRNEKFLKSISIINAAAALLFFLYSFYVLVI